MDQLSMQQEIQNAIAQAQKNEIKRTELFTNPEASGKHEFLFFIKPEITLANTSIQLEAILKLIFKKIDQFGFSIKNCLLLPAKYLEKHNIIAQHYGVINAIARNALGNLTQAAKASFEKQFNIKFSDAAVFGGLEFLDKFPELSATSLDYLWQNSPAVKLGGGAYAQKLNIDGDLVFLVNGFHARQLEHFISAGRSIVAFTLVSDLDWAAARNEFIGKTNPEAAAAGSIRRELLEHSNELGLKAVTSSWNGVHLSAGPVEGLVELIRYNSDFESGKALDAAAFSFGKKLTENFSGEEVQKILANTNVSYQGKTESIFDLTEEKNTDEALKILAEIKF